jgi:hypothetical protein
LFIIPLFLVFAAYALGTFFSRVKNKLIIIAVLLVIFAFPIFQVFLLAINPQKAWLPKNERSGYLEIWAAGYGIKEASIYLREIAKTQKVLVGTEGFFGTLPDGLEIYLEKVPNITIIGVGQPVLDISPKLIDGLSENRVFLLVNDTRLKINNNPKLILKAKYPKAVSTSGQQENLLLFEVTK